MHDTATRGPFDRGGAVVGGEQIPVGEPSNVAGVTDQMRGEDRADAIDLGQRRARCFDGDTDPAVRLLQLGVEPADVVEKLEGEVVADLLGRGRRLLVRERVGV